MSDHAEPTPQTADEQGRAGATQSRRSRNELERELKALRDGWGANGGPLDALRRCALAAHAGRWKTIARLTLRSVTPIYGGGSTPGQVDWLLPFRPRAIKNAIRHWWWLLNRHQYAGRAGDLYKAMVAIWGGPSEEENDCSARVRVIVNGPQPEDVDRHRFTYLPYRCSTSRTVTQDPDDPWLYALFGAKGKPRGQARWDEFKKATKAINAGAAGRRYRLNQDQTVFAERPADLLAPGLSFELRICTRDLDAAQCEQIKDAFAFWIAFGGIGARTSRGLGHLEILEMLDVQGGRQQTTTILLSEWLRRIETQLGKVHGGGDSWQGMACDSSMAAWQEALKNYRDFRQLRPPRNGTPGRSCWPKADVVRALTRKTLTDEYHHNLIHTAVPHVAAGADQRIHRDVAWPVPEMYFGAPIVVQFANAQGLRDPYTVRFLFAQPSRQLEVLERFPSPVLTVPWFDCKTGQWHPRIVALPYASDLDGLQVVVRNEQPAREQRKRNQFFFHSKSKDGPAFLPRETWWPSSGQRTIWNGTPYQATYDKARSLVNAGDTDPIKTLFNFLHGRPGLP